MFTNTGNLSFWLSISFIAMSLCGLFFIYSIIKNDKLENDRIDKIIELGKWFIGSVAIVLSASIVIDGFKERDQDIKEMAIFDKYLTTVLEADGIMKRLMLSSYFAAVSPEGSIKTSWMEYKKVVTEEVNKYENDKKRLAELQVKMEATSTASSPAERQEAEFLEVKIAASNKSLVSQSDQDWAIFAGSDPTLETAGNEIKKIEKYPVSIYRKLNRYRTVVGPFSDRNAALSALPEIRKVNASSYLVNLRTWCESSEMKEGYIECRSK